METSPIQPPHPRNHLRHHHHHHSLQQQKSIPQTQPTPPVQLRVIIIPPMLILPRLIRLHRCLLCHPYPLDHENAL